MRQSLDLHIPNFALDSHFGVAPWSHSIAVTIRKPNTLSFVSAVGITIERNRHARVSILKNEEVCIVLGSNLGDRFGNFEKTLKRFKKRELRFLMYRDYMKMNRCTSRSNLNPSYQFLLIKSSANANRDTLLKKYSKTYSSKLAFY